MTTNPPPSPDAPQQQREALTFYANRARAALSHAPQPESGREEIAALVHAANRFQAARNGEWERHWLTELRAALNPFLGGNKFYDTPTPAPIAKHYAKSRSDGFGYRDCSCGARVKDGEQCPPPIAEANAMGGEVEIIEDVLKTALAKHGRYKECDDDEVTIIFDYGAITREIVSAITLPQANTQAVSSGDES